MAISKFRKIVELEIKEKGLVYLHSESFNSLVKKTVITKRKQTDEYSIYAWYDAENSVLFECSSKTADASNIVLPEIGHVTRIIQRKEYLREYAKQKTTQIHLRFTDKDSDVVIQLTKQPNKQAYIKRLIREDIKRQNK